MLGPQLIQYIYELESMITLVIAQKYVLGYLISDGARIEIGTSITTGTFAEKPS